jgi:hypothetical protein
VLHANVKWNGEHDCVFRLLRKVAWSDYQLHCVCPSTWNNSAPTRRIFIKFYTQVFFEKSIEKVELSLQSDKNNEYFTSRCSAVMIITRWILLKIRNVSDRSCREIKNMHFVFGKFIPYIHTYIYGKTGNVRITWHSGAFAEPLLQWKSKFSLFVCVCVCVCVCAYGFAHVG